MSPWEIGGFIAGAVSVLLDVRQSVWAWPIGIANSACWLVLFWSYRLYLDAGLQVVYIGMGVAGWYWWLRGGGPAGLSVTRTRRREALVLAAVGLAVVAGLTWLMTLAGDALPLADAATTTVSLIAQYMLTRKLIESWWLWIAVDVAYVVMYASQELYLTAALQPLFIVLCVLGLRQWQASMATAPVVPVEPVAVAR